MATFTRISTSFQMPYPGTTSVVTQKININGTAEDDVLFGNSADNFMYGIGGDDTFMGSAGADEMHGSDGSDMADYSQSRSAVTVDLLAGTGRGGDAQGDRYVSIENVKGSSYADRLYGDNSANTLDGGSGHDTIS